MLPPGLTAQPAERPMHRQLQVLHPGAKTVARLLVGACSCDLVRPRQETSREDERHHRERHRKAGGRREPLLDALERHRRGAAVPTPSGGWPRALASFVVEHARNAGPTLYLLRFVTDATTATEPLEIPRRETRAALVGAQPHGWLEEDVALLVRPGP
jgi:hypothetical protein